MIRDMRFGRPRLLQVDVGGLMKSGVFAIFISLFASFSYLFLVYLIFEYCVVVSKMALIPFGQKKV